MTLCLGLAFAAMVIAEPARAAEESEADRAAARSLAADAKESFDKGDYATALDLYRRASELMPAPTLTVRQARCLVRLDRLIEAREMYVRTLRMPLDAKAPPPFRAALREAEAELTVLEKEIPRLRVALARRGDDVRIFIDDKPLPPALIGADAPVDPGEHTLKGTIDGVAVIPRHVIIAKTQRIAVDLTTDEQPPVKPVAAPPVETTPPSETAAIGSESRSDEGGIPPRTWAWVAFGVGTVGLGVGITSGLVATNEKSSLDEQCPNGRCPPSAESDLDSFRTMRTISTVGYIAGGVGIATGVVLLLVTPAKRTAAARVEPHPWLGGAGVRGTF